MFIWLCVAKRSAGAVGAVALPSCAHVFIEFRWLQSIWMFLCIVWPKYFFWEGDKKQRLIVMSRLGAAAITVGALAAPAFLTPSASSPGSQLRGAEVSQSVPKTTQNSTAAGVLGAAAVTAVASFVTGKRPSTRAAGPVQCQAFDPSTQVGATAPLGFFDPAGFTKGIDEKGFKKLRSYELRHARGAMMGSLGLLVQSVYKFPGFQDVPSGLAAQWTEPGSNALWLLVGAIGCFDVGLSPWKEDPENPGDFGDPLNLAKGNVSDDIRTLDLLWFVSHCVVCCPCHNTE